MTPPEMTASEPAPGRSGRLVLMPNALDLGSDVVPLGDVLPQAAIVRAAALVHWVVEDARSARAFLKRVHALVPLGTPLQALNIQELPRPRKGSNEAVPSTQWAALLAPLRAGADVGLLSEAGLPAVADPGAELVACAHAAGLPVEVLAGPSSLLMALAASGLNGQSFAFLGYLPQDAAARAARIKETEAWSRKHNQTQICIETPYRNAAMLASLVQALSPATRLSVSIGLTLKNAHTHTEAVSAWRRLAPDLVVRLSDKTPAVFSWLAA